MTRVERMKRKNFEGNLLRPQYGSSDDAAGLFGTVYQLSEKYDLQRNSYRPAAGFAESTAIPQK
jgi:hypothetical protein